MKTIKINEIIKTREGFSLTLRRDYRAAFGFGEKFDSVDQKGKFVRACVREKCFAQGEYTYLSMPFFLTPDGFGVYVDTYVETDFDFTREGEIVISFWEGSRGEQAEVYLFEGTPKEILTQFRKKVGMPRLFPKWVLGAWMSANRWRTQADAEEQLALNQKYGFPHSVFVLEPWSDLTTRYLWNGCSCPFKAGDETVSYEELDFSRSEQWRDPRALIEKIHGENMKLLLWLVPIYAQGNDLETDCNVAQCLSDNEYAKAQGDCVANADGTPYLIPHTWCIGSMIPDFTNPEAKARYLDRFSYLMTIGADGFKTDGGEFVHEKTVRFADGTTGIEGQNAYCEQYSEAFSELAGERGIVFSRAGGQRSPCFSVIWAGDQESTWSEFSSVLKAGLSAGLSGVCCWGFDIAGFSGYLPSEELYLRAVQAAAFVPVMQWHSDPVSNGRCDFTGAWKRNDRSPWNMAAYLKGGREGDLLSLLRRQFFLHYNLLPYQYLLMKRASETGIPALRHLALEFPGEEWTYRTDDEFMLGDALLIAPVLQDYRPSRTVRLPEGNWFGLYDGKRLSGGIYEVPLTREHLPVYLRENCCVPLNLSGGELCSDVGNDLAGYRELTFLVSGEGSDLFEDDLGNEILLRWDRTSHRAEYNRSGISFRVMHAEAGTEER